MPRPVRPPRRSGKHRHRHRSWHRHRPGLGGHRCSSRGPGPTATVTATATPVAAGGRAGAGRRDERAFRDAPVPVAGRQRLHDADRHHRAVRRRPGRLRTGRRSGPDDSGFWGPAVSTTGQIHAFQYCESLWAPAPSWWQIAAWRPFWPSRPRCCSGCCRCGRPGAAGSSRWKRRTRTANCAPCSRNSPPRRGCRRCHGWSSTRPPGRPARWCSAAPGVRSCAWTAGCWSPATATPCASARCCCTNSRTSPTATSPSPTPLSPCGGSSWSWCSCRICCCRATGSTRPWRPAMCRRWTGRCCSRRSWSRWSTSPGRTPCAAVRSTPT